MNKEIFNSMVKLGIALCLLSVMVLGSVSPVQAAEFNEYGAVPAGKTVDDDLFLAGQNVVMAGTVNGTLFVSGETVNISGTVNGDVFAGGRIILVEKGAKITGNLFAGAAQIRVNGEVGGTIFGGSALMVLEDQSMVGRNVFYGGFSYEMAKNSMVKIDQFLGGRQVVLNGTTGGDVNIAAAAVEINGTVGGDANIEVEQPGQRTPNFDFGPDTSVVAIPSGLRISPEASIEGKLTYTSSVDQSTALQGNISQPPVFQTPVPEEQNRSGDYNQMPESIVKTVAPITASGFAISLWFVKVVREFLTLFILGCLGLWLLPKASVKVSSVFKKQLFPSFGYGILVTMIGFIALFIVPILFIAIGIFLSAVSLGGLAPAYFGVIGLALTLIAAIFLFLVFTGSMVVGSYAIGEAILAKSTSLSGGKRFLALLIGVLIIAVTTAIPFIGGLWGILVAMTGMGAFWRTFKQSRNITTSEIQ